jgi:DNA mismatch repair protein MutL
MLLRLALPHPHISFKLLHNGRASLDLPATTAEDRWLAAWPEEFQEQRLPIDVRDAEMRLIGLIGLPELARPTAKYQHLFLNGRPIRDRFIQHALREAYRGLTEPGRHPAAILLLSVPPQDVDVNVHPTKSEVRFRDGGRIHGLVLSSVREKLLGSDLSPSAMAFSNVMPANDAFREDMRTKLANFFRQMPGETVAPTTAPFAPFALAPSPAPAPMLPLSTSITHDALAGASLVSPSSTATEGETRLPPATEYRERGPDVAPALVPAPAAVLQLHNSYLVAPSEDGLVIIDQHALHERIMYEDLLARVSRGPLESQRLLIPEVFTASSRQIAMLDHIQPMLARLGIEVAPFGPDSIAVQGFPSFLEKLNPGDFVRELLERGEQELLDLHDEELLHEVLDMMACKAAVKAGDPLTQGEIEALLARRDLVERSSNCPHGRPTTLRLSLRDLEKQFKRTGF